MASSSRCVMAAVGAAGSAAVLVSELISFLYCFTAVKGFFYYIAGTRGNVRVVGDRAPGVTMVASTSRAWSSDQSVNFGA